MTLPIEPTERLPAAPSEDHGGLALYRLWHPSSITPAADRLRTWGPAWRFDPHPPVADGGAIDRPDGPGAWYGAESFTTAVRETHDRFAPHAADRVVEVCARSRLSLVRLPSPTLLLDLTAHAQQLGAPSDLGDRPDTDYAVTQAFARALHATGRYDGLRYPSARDRTPQGLRAGTNVVLWRVRSPGLTVISDVPLALPGAWRRVLGVLAHADIGAIAVPTCGACVR